MTEREATRGQIAHLERAAAITREQIAVAKQIVRTEFDEEPDNRRDLVAAVLHALATNYAAGQVASSIK